MVVRWLFFVYQEGFVDEQCQDFDFVDQLFELMFVLYGGCCVGCQRYVIDDDVGCVDWQLMCYYVVGCDDCVGVDG